MPIGIALLLIFVGLLIGSASGMVGIGGGILIIPILMIGFGFSQARANGTSLAMLMPPIGVLAVIAYARAGNVDWRFAILLAAGFTVGAAIGGVVVNRGWVNPTTLRVLFAMLLLYVASRTLFRPGGQARAAIETILLIAAFLCTYWFMRLLGQRWSASSGYWGIIYRARRRETTEYDYEI